MNHPARRLWGPRELHGPNAGAGGPIPGKPSRNQNRTGTRIYQQCAEPVDQQQGHSGEADTAR